MCGRRQRSRHRPHTHLVACASPVQNSAQPSDARSNAAPQCTRRAGCGARWVAMHADCCMQRRQRATARTGGGGERDSDSRQQSCSCRHQPARPFLRLRCTACFAPRSEVDAGRTACAVRALCGALNRLEDANTTQTPAGVTCDTPCRVAIQRPAGLHAVPQLDLRIHRPLQLLPSLARQDDARRRHRRPRRARRRWPHAAADASRHAALVARHGRCARPLHARCRARTCTRTRTRRAACCFT